MIDLHTHILPLVDDGSESIESSLSVLKKYQKKGVKAVVLTPHYKGKYKTHGKELFTLFLEFCKTVHNNGIDIKLYLGQEIHNYSGIINGLKQEKLLSINDSKYVLLELEHSRKHDLTESVYSLIRAGYIPIIAHVERYAYLMLSQVKELKELGALIQVNAGSVVAINRRRRKKRAKTLIKNGLVDFIASDAHVNRKNYFFRAYRRIKLRFGKTFANELFYLNASKILNIT
jgi:protein-tyrosine phosphatase